MEVPDSIEVRNRADVVITWSGGDTTVLAASRLRAGCPCASCREPAGIRSTAAVLAGDRPVEIAEARLVGSYAVSFVFDPDHHDTGIFPFEMLRRLGEV